jgi:hypothetical protein
MFPTFHTAPAYADRAIRPDRRAPRANEIRLRVKRTLSRQEV